MNKLLLFPVMLLLLQSMAFAAEETPETVFGAQELVIGVELSSSFELVAKGSDYSADYVQVNLTLFPKETMSQSVKAIELTPMPKTTGEAILFEWLSPAPGKYSYRAEFETTTARNAVPITGKAKFPIATIDDSLKKYATPTENIDSGNPEITELAYSLAEGEDDLFVVVYKLARWANLNIEYNLSTLTADVSKPASWVLQNRQGVCDELTNLFIALNRALGIPARFVSGVSYTDSPLFPENWGFHGWAEVYFPGYGWVPFDVTYGEFGYVDASHVVMIESADIAETTTGYRWKGRNIGLETSDIKPRVFLKSASGTAPQDIELSSAFLKDSVGFGSYNIEEVEVSNRRSHYAIAELLHSTTEGMELLGEHKRDILLKPGETKLEYFVFRVNAGLREGYVYTFPATVEAGLAEAKAQFKASERGTVYALEDVEGLRIWEQEEKVYSRNIRLECSSAKEIYIYEQLQAECTATNTGNTVLENLEFCHKAECEKFSLGIAKSKVFNVTTEFASPGKNRAKFDVESDDVAKTGIIEVNVLDIPSVRLANITLPESVAFNEEFEITATAEKDSDSPVLNLEVSVKKVGAEFAIGELKETRRLIAGVSALKLEEGENKIAIEAEFEDKNGRKYSEKAEATVNVRKLNFMQKAQRFFLRLFS